MQNIYINLINNKSIPKEIKLINKRLSDFETFIQLTDLYPTKDVFIRFLDKKEYLLTRSNFDYYSGHFDGQKYEIIFKKPVPRPFNPSGGGWDSVMRW